MLLPVLTTPELLAAYDVDRPTRVIAATGIAKLEALTGGMIGGRVWIIVGAPGQGSSTLVTQWAGTSAEVSDRTVHLVTPRATPSVIASRLLSRTGRVPLPHLTNHMVERDEEERLGRARDRLAALNLRVWPMGEGVFVPEVHPAEPEETSGLFVDDADRVSGLTPARVAAWAATGLFVLVSLPRHEVLVTPDREADLVPTWAGVADVVMEIRSRGLNNAVLRPGEAELRLHYNRWGFVQTVLLHHEAHFSRFLEPPAQRQGS